MAEEFPNPPTERYLRKVMRQWECVPLDVIRPLVSSSLEDDELRGDICCTKCFTPWKAGLYRSHLLKRPKLKKSQLIKALLRKERKNVKRLKNSEKLRLSLYRTRRNTLEIECLVCKEKFKAYCPLPENMKKSLPVREPRKTIQKAVDIGLLTDKKKKKKRAKELNAGLLISSPNSEYHKKLKKSKHQEQLKGDKPPGITEISPQRDNLWNGNSEESKDNSDIGEVHSKKDVVERIVDTLPVNKVLKVQSGLLVSKKSKTKSKERDFLNKTIKLKMEKDVDRSLKNKTALGDFLSSLI